MMNAADFLDAILPEYRAEIGPIVGFDFIDRFVVQNRPRLLRSLEPLMALLAEERAPTAEACQACGTELEPMGAHGIGCPRCANIELDELDKQATQADPDAVTPEKDAIVWAAFTKLVNQKRREIGMNEIEATESLPFLKKLFGRRDVPCHFCGMDHSEDVESLPRFEGKSVGRINDRGWGSEVAADKMTARSRALWNREHDRCSEESARALADTWIRRSGESIESLPSCGCGPTRSEMAESLPRPRDRDAPIAPFKRGDYVIRLGDMLGMEGELGGYIMAIDDGTAKIEQDNGEIKPWPLDSLLHDTQENRAKRQAFDDKIAADASVRVDQAILEWKAR